MAENSEVIINSCCNVWKDKFTKLQQKFAKVDEGRTALRKVIEIYEKQLGVVQEENLKLKKAYEEKLEKDNEREAEVKESASRVSLENEISSLKSEISELRRKGGSETECVDEELILLRARVADGEKEINRLHEQLQKERSEANNVMMKAEAEKNRAVEACNSAEAERNRNKEELALLQARLRNEESERSQLRDHLRKEKARADSEKKKADEAQDAVRIEKVKVEGLQAEKEREEREKQSIRCSLEAEIFSLKSQVLLLQEEDGSKEQNLAEMKLLQTNVSELEAEISRLKNLIDKERIRADCEMQKAETEKKKAIEAWQNVKTEKRIAEEQRNLADIARRKADESEIRLEKLKTEADEARSKLVLEISKYEEANKKFEAEKHKVAKEKKQVEEQRKAAKMSRRNAQEEKSHADSLQQQLEEGRRRYDELKKEMEEAISSRKYVEEPLNLRGKQINGASVEPKGLLLVEKLKDKVDGLNSDKAKKKLEQMKQKANQEKIRADLEMRKAEEQKKVAEAFKGKAIEEEGRADRLAEQLKEHARKNEDLEKELQDLALSRNLTDAPIVPIVEDVSAESAEMNLLRKKLKLERRQVKLAKEVAKLEKERKNIAEGELSLLKLEFAQFSHRLGLCNCFAACNVGKAHLQKNAGASLKRKVMDSEVCLVHLQSRNGRLNPRCTPVDTSGCFKESRECSVRLLNISGNCTESTSGIASKQEPMLSGSNRKIVQSSAIDSSMASFSDRQLMGSQGRGAFSITKSAERAGEKFNFPIDQLSSEFNKRSNNENIAIIDDNRVKSHLRVDAVGRTAKHSKKRTLQKVADDLSTLEHVLADMVEKPLGEGNCVISKLAGDICTKQEQHHKMRTTFPGEVTIQHSCNRNNLKDEAGTKPVGGSDVSFHVFADNVKEATQAFNNELDKSGSEILEEFEHVADGDYMKLLDLNNSADEEYYRRAIDAPLSPTLPEIELQSTEDDVGRSSHTIVDFCPHCVVFPDIDDSSSLSNIFHTATSLKDYYSIPQTDHFVHRMLSALLEVKSLSPKEKVCVFVSVLVHSISATSLMGNLFDSGFFHFLDIVVGQIHKALSDIETRRLFAKVCDLDEVLTLIENFLIDERVLVNAGGDSEIPVLSDPKVHICQNSACIAISFRKASPHQLVCGAVTLASLCGVFDRIGFICEASYNVARKKAMDSSILTFLHVFAYICGSKYFTLQGYSDVMAVIKSIVVFHERESLPTAAAFSDQHAGMEWPEFPSCIKCPFFKGSVSMEAIASLLLEKLQNFILSSFSHEDFMRSVNLLNLEVLTTYVEPNSSHGDCDLCKGGPVSSCMHKSGKMKYQTKHVSDGTLCTLGEILSLLELVASNMNWDWICCNIVGQLLKMLESSVVKHRLAAILILLGQMARLGIDAKGYQDTEVENIRSRLCAFLSQSSIRKVSPPIQIAAVSALLGMISLNFEEVVNSNEEFSAVPSLSIPADCIRKWFSLQSNEQRSLSLKLLTASAPSWRNVAGSSK